MTDLGVSSGETALEPEVMWLLGAESKRLDHARQYSNVVSMFCVGAKARELSELRIASQNNASLTRAFLRECDSPDRTLVTRVGCHAESPSHGLKHGHTLERCTAWFEKARSRGVGSTSEEVVAGGRSVPHESAATQEEPPSCERKLSFLCEDGRI